MVHDTLADVKHWNDTSKLYTLHGHSWQSHDDRAQNLCHRFSNDDINVFIENGFDQNLCIVHEMTNIVTTYIV